MPLSKNQIIPLTIESLSSDGSGVGHYEGLAVFVPGTAPGDVLRAKIVKPAKRYAFAIVDFLEVPSPDRIAPDCAVAGPCGGCCYRHITYAAELAAKQQAVQDAFRRIGGLDIPCLPILPSPQDSRYRNKVQFPVGLDKDGHVVTGFFAPRTHRIVPCPDCQLQPVRLNEIAQSCCELLEALHIPPYNEETADGLVRHLFLREGYHSQEIMVCLVVAGKSLPAAADFVGALTEKYPHIATILLNHNSEKSNVILGRENTVLYGPGFIRETLCGVPVQLGPLSFYQVNTPGAEQLYAQAAAMAQLRPGDRLLDLYCGMGTIGLSMAAHCKQLIGVEVVDEAVKSARRNAAEMGVSNATFYCADAGQAATKLAAEGTRPDVVILDPPRKGCDEKTLQAVVTMAPRRIVMVSCNAATAARDAAWLAQNGYLPEALQPVDMFARTKHCECVLSFARISS